MLKFHLKDYWKMAVLLENIFFTSISYLVFMETGISVNGSFWLSMSSVQRNSGNYANSSERDLRVWFGFGVWFCCLFRFFKNLIFFNVLEYQMKRKYWWLCTAYHKPVDFPEMQLLPGGGSWSCIYSPHLFVLGPSTREYSNTPPGFLSSSNPWLLLLLEVFAS